MEEIVYDVNGLLIILGEGNVDGEVVLLFYMMWKFFERWWGQLL